MAEERREQDQDLIFALDIGTRSIIGMVGRREDERFHVLAVAKKEHERRAMLDGQIEDIQRVARVAAEVTRRLEEQLNVRLTQVCVAAAGRSLRMERGHFEAGLPTVQRVTPEMIGRLEAGAVAVAEALLSRAEEQEADAPLHRMYLVGYTATQYQLDHYPMTTILDHNGQNLQVDVVATFLPSEVVESLYSAMHTAGLEVISLTLEPIAALNAAIPAELRLLNLALVDVGAGTSDIAICRDGSVVGYTMATVAGDEVTETVMRAYLVDFHTAELLKQAMTRDEPYTFVDILGLERQVSPQELRSVAEPAARTLAEEIGRRILEVNGGAPSAVFLSGGGSKLGSLKEAVADCLDMPDNRIAVAGSNFDRSAFADDLDLNDPEYATPLGIAVSAGLGLIHDSYIVTLNGQTAKLFGNGSFTAQDVLVMNGYAVSDLLGRTGQSLTVTLNGKRMSFRGEPGTPCFLRVNGEDAAAATPVHAGDELTFVPARHGDSVSMSVRELLGGDFCGSVMVNGEETPLTTALRSGDVVLTAAAPQSEPEPAEQAPPLPITLNGRPITLEPKDGGTPYFLMDLLSLTNIDFQHLDHPVSLQVNGQEGYFRQVLQTNDTVTIQIKD